MLQLKIAPLSNQRDGRQINVTAGKSARRQANQRNGRQINMVRANDDRHYALSFRVTSVPHASFYFSQRSDKDLHKL